MGFKEKMMGSMMGNMSAEDKSEMMSNMMEQFFGTMSDDEKQEMMKDMMPKMMEQMMGSKGGGMMNMMGMMMGRGKVDPNGADEESNPMDMCGKMMSNMSRTSEMAVHATPEIQTLFNEWLEQIENEFLDYMKEQPQADSQALMTQFELSRESVIYILAKLAQKGKINIKVDNVQPASDE